MRSTFFFTNLLICISAGVLFSSCSKKNEEGKYIPANASMALHLNTKALTKKLPWEEIKKQNYFQALNADTSTTAFMRTLMENPENSGIKMDENIIIFLVTDEQGGYFAVEGEIKDKAKFAAMQAEMKTGNDVKMQDGWNTNSGSRNLTAWNDKRFIALSDVPEMKTAPKLPMMEGDTTMKAPPLVFRDLNTALAALTNLKESNSMAGNDHFTTLMKTSGDIHAWINIEAFTANMPTTPQMSMINLNKLYQGSQMAATVNFDDGKINIDTKSYASPEMTAVWKKYSGKAMDETMVKQIPIKNIAAFFALNFNPEGVREFLKIAGLDGLINMGSGMLGFNLDEFISANKGDILVAVGDLEKDSADKPSMKFLFSASIGNKENFTKIISAGKKFGQQQMATSGKLPDLFYNVNDKYFTLGNSQVYADNFIQGTNTTMPPLFSEISGKPAGGYINFQYIMKSLQNRAFPDSLDKLSLEASLNTWDHLIFSGGDLDGDAAKQHAEIILVNKNENSLKQLNNYAGIMSNIINERRKNQKPYDNMDSTIVVAPTK
ncbi:MAG: DUF4836 family protein [Ferruginibacter sp.]